MVVESELVDVLMSVHPRYADQIRSGEKTVEFRRKAARRAIRHLLVYATFPVREIVAFARVKAVVEGSLESLWEQFGAMGGITRAEFDEYFEGVSEGTAYVLFDVKQIKEPLAKVDVSAAPQSFVYLDASVTSFLGSEHRA